MPHHLIISTNHTLDPFDCAPAIRRKGPASQLLGGRGLVSDDSSLLAWRQKTKKSSGSPLEDARRFMQFEEKEAAPDGSGKRPSGPVEIVGRLRMEEKDVDVWRSLQIRQAIASVGSMLESFSIKINDFFDDITREVDKREMDVLNIQEKVREIDSIVAKKNGKVVKQYDQSFRLDLSVCHFHFHFYSLYVHV
jgi:hypothetical protein